MLALLPDSMQDLLDAPPALTQILGDQGSGKTSLLLAMQRSFLEKGRRVTYEYLPLDAADYKTKLNQVDMFLLDEAQRLSAPALQRLLSHTMQTPESGLHLMLSTHADLSPHAARLGIPLRSVQLDGYSHRFLHELVEERVSYFERPGYKGTRLTTAALTLLTTHCGADLRELERLLYEIYQAWDSEGPITVEFVRGFLDIPAQGS